MHGLQICMNVPSIMPTTLSSSQNFEIHSSQFAGGFWMEKQF